MAYAKKTWVSGETPLSAENMNNIENGIADAHEDIIKLNMKSNKLDNYISYGSNTETHAKGNFVNINVPAGVYLVFGYLNLSSETASAWINGVTDTNNALYLKITNMQSFTKLITMSAAGTISLQNLNGTKLTAYRSTYIGAVRINDV